jgi:ribosomal protein S18 acetylase RimI-like enzyme
MDIEIRLLRPAELDLYAQVPCAFHVDTLLVVEPIAGGLGGLRMREEAVVPPYVKDYDASGEDTPTDWPRMFDVRNWGFLLAQEGERPIAGAAVAWRTPGVHMLANRDDMAVLWDIRVHPDFRRQGVGERIFWRAADWAREQGARLLKIETQNVNVRACHFYRQQGCRLGEIDCYGYAGNPHVAHEVMLIWYLDL